MIKEIISFRRQGMSFRKIAEKLNSTVGKVHYQWIKNVKNSPNTYIDSDHEKLQEELKEKSKRNEPFLNTRLVSENRLVSFWEIAPWQKKLVASYFNCEINQSVIVFRIYDVTDIHFNGINAHTFYEFQLPDEKNYWFIKGIKPGRSYLTEIGYRLNNHSFFPILRSNSVHGLQTIQSSVHVLNNYSNKDQNNKPIWIDKVSTYSYYENIKEEKQMDGKE